MVDITRGKTALAEMTGGTVGSNIARMIIAGGEAIVFETYGLRMTNLTETSGRRSHRLDKTAVRIE